MMLVRTLRDADASLLIPEPRISVGTSQARREEENHSTEEAKLGKSRSTNNLATLAHLVLLIEGAC